MQGFWIDSMLWKKSGLTNVMELLALPCKESQPHITGNQSCFQRRCDDQARCTSSRNCPASRPGCKQTTYYFFQIIFICKHNFNSVLFVAGASLPVVPATVVVPPCSRPHCLVFQTCQCLALVTRWQCLII